MVILPCKEVEEVLVVMQVVYLLKVNCGDQEDIVNNYITVENVI